MSESNTEQPSNDEVQFNQFVELLREQNDWVAIYTFFEEKLEQQPVGHKNALAAFEEAGILPDDTSPNPFNPETEEQQFDQWFAQHPKEAEQHHANVEEREKAIRYLYLGTILGDILGKRLYPNHQYLVPRRGQ